MQVMKTSLLTGVVHTREIPVTPEKLKAWSERKAGYTGLIQDVFPELSKDDREFLLTGATPEEWDTYFVGGVK